MIDNKWKEKYFVKSYGSPPTMHWAVFSSRWRPISPLKRVSPWFNTKIEAVKWIQLKWDAHISKKFEQMFLSDNSHSETKD